MSGIVGSRGTTSIFKGKDFVFSGITVVHLFRIVIVAFLSLPLNQGNKRGNTDDFNWSCYFKD